MTRPYVIGFSSLTEKLSFAQGVRTSLEAEAARYPEVTLIVRDNDQDDRRALANSQEFADLPVDLAMIYHINERVGPKLAQPLRSKRIPVISVEVAIPFTTFLGIDNQQMGLLSGQALGEWIAAHWQGQVDKILLLTDYRLTGMIKRRLEYAVAGMASVIDISGIAPFFIDSGNIREVAAKNALPVLENWGTDQRIAVIGQNDDTTLGAIDAAKMLGMESHVAGVGYGATEIALEELKTPGSSLVASIDMYPEKYGEPLLDLALRMLNSEKVPATNLIQPRCLTLETLAD